MVGIGNSMGFELLCSGALREYKPASQTIYRHMANANAEGRMNTVVCSTSMASAFNVVLNLACIWLLFIIMADVRQIRKGGNNVRGKI